LTDLGQIQDGQIVPDSATLALCDRVEAYAARKGLALGYVCMVIFGTDDRVAKLREGGSELLPSTRRRIEGVILELEGDETGEVWRAFVRNPPRSRRNKARGGRRRRNSPEPEEEPAVALTS
jgi:hypothetical protein